jgi:hypothetical protein
MLGFAFRAGRGPEWPSINQYSIGYVLPKGTICMNSQEIISKVGRCDYFDDGPFIKK